MSLSSIVTAAARFVGRVGNQAAVSLVASAAAAAFLALPGFMAGSTASSEPLVASSEPVGWASPVAPDGKIRERHHDAIGGEGLVQALSGRSLATPAALVMPMTLGWSQPAADAPDTVRMSTAQAPEPAPLSVKAAVVLPPRRPAALAERIRPVEPMPPSEPLRLAGAIDMTETADAPRPPATILGRELPVPVGYIGGKVSGAVGLVGAAGSWTVARAASLVPGL